MDPEAEPVPFKEAKAPKVAEKPSRTRDFSCEIPRCESWKLATPIGNVLLRPCLGMVEKLEFFENTGGDQSKVAKEGLSIDAAFDDAPQS